MPQTPYNEPITVSRAYTHISNAGTTLVKATPGSLFSININSGVSEAALTLFDQVTTVTGTNTIAALALTLTEAGPVNLPFGVAGSGLTFKNGLCIVAAGTIDATVLYA